MHLLQAFSVAAALLPALSAAQKYVFAHVVVGDTAAHTTSTWENDITLAHDAGIDAFALNIVSSDPNSSPQVANAFSAAESLNNGFKLFFSFDYSVTWSASDVASYLNQYKGSAAYFTYGSSNLPFASTFEGPDSSGDWSQGGAIRGSVGDLFFVPDYTSVGPSGIADKLADIDGFFSWNAWPAGAADMTDSPDLAWQAAINPKPYMMGVAPWFFHSASGGTDWVWRGDDLWADRWNQTLQVQPEFVEIITWNDYGEAHYIGPMGADSEIPDGSGQFDANMPHDSWRDFLPYYIATYKGNTFDITRDQMQYWYRTAPAAGGQECQVINSPDPSNPGSDVNSVVQDNIFFSALLTSDATLTVQIGSGTPVPFSGVAGINHFSTPFSGQTGAPVFSIVRDNVTVNNGTGTPITSTTSLSSGCTNYNAWVGSF
ncbi:MAG: hypothetical protein M1818_003602 [Claussenomyces sp. TS43310]|nr:MAG: hypothetical protein M1818_003602 [Claussenomyces sp. TS43310]